MALKSFLIWSFVYINKKNSIVSRSLIAIKIRHVCMLVSFLSHPRTSEKKTLQVVIYCVEHFGMLHIFKIFISFKIRDGIIIMIKYLNL